MQFSSALVMPWKIYISLFFFFGKKFLPLSTQSSVGSFNLWSHYAMRISRSYSMTARCIGVRKLNSAGVFRYQDLSRFIGMNRGKKNQLYRLSIGRKTSGGNDLRKRLHFRIFVSSYLYFWQFGVFYGD